MMGPQVLTNTYPGMRVLDPYQKLPRGSHFLSLANLLLMGDRSLPFDAFCPSRPKAQILDSTCQKCKICFPNKTQKVRHENSCHRVYRKSAGVSLDSLPDFESTDVDEVLCESDGFFYCAVAGIKEWRKLPEIHGKVIEYRRKKSV